MKKLNLLLASIILTLASYAQNNLFEELSKYQKETFKSYYISYNYLTEEITLKDDDHKYSIELTQDNYEMPIGISVSTENYSSRTYSFDPMDDCIDHYTQPIFARSTDSKKRAFVMVDGLLFLLESTNEDLTEFGDSYAYGTVFIPESVLQPNKKEKSDADGKKKFGGKLKEMLLGSSIVLPPVLKEISTVEGLETKINTYISSMKEKQKNTYLSSEENNRWQEVLAMKQKASDDLKAYNDKYWKSDEGQRVIKQMNQQDKDKCSFYIKNTGTQSIYYTTHLTPFSISPGQTSEFNCNDKVYRSNNNGDKLNLIGGGGSSFSGRTISVN